MSEQPMPTRGKASIRVAGMAECLYNEALSHQIQKGMEKHGTPLYTFNSRDAFADCRQELVDAQQYLTQAEMERNEIVRRAQAMAEALRATGCDCPDDNCERCQMVRRSLSAWDELGLEVGT